ncbi:MAG: hypothetical protein QXN96_00840 [Candidatus Bathyarchaeia archaeon]
MAQRGEIRKEDLIFNQCFVCKSWWFENDLVLVKVPDQAGTVEKPVCVDCIFEARNKSAKARSYFDYLDMLEGQ